MDVLPANTPLGKLDCQSDVDTALAEIQPQFVKVLTYCLVNCAPFFGSVRLISYFRDNVILSIDPIPERTSTKKTKIPTPNAGSKDCNDLASAINEVFPQLVAEVGYCLTHCAPFTGYIAMNVSLQFNKVQNARISHKKTWRGAAKGRTVTADEQLRIA